MKDKVTGDQSESEASGLETGADSGGLTVTAYSRRERARANISIY